MKKLLYIARYIALAVLLSLLLALAPAMAQNVVYQGETTQLGVDQRPGDKYTWELYSDSTVNFATVPGDSSPSYAEFVGGSDGTPVSVLWKEPGTYFFKVTARDINGCTNNLKIGKMKVLHALPTAIITEPDVKGICVGETTTLQVTLTGTDPWSFTYTATDINGVTSTVTQLTYTSPCTIVISPLTTTIYQIISITDKYGTNTVTPSNTVTQIVNPLPAPSTIYHR